MQDMFIPQRITPDVRRLCRKLGDVDEPVFIAVEPRTDSSVNVCFDDARDQAAEHGGSVQCGWLIWEWPGIMVEGVFHGVWRRPDGVLVDVSFKQDGETRVLFVPDRTRIFADKMVPAIAHPIGSDPLIRKYISMTSRFDQLVSDRYRHRLGEQITLDPELTELNERKLEIGAHLLTLGRAFRSRGQ